MKRTWSADKDLVGPEPDEQLGSVLDWFTGGLYTPIKEAAEAISQFRKDMMAAWSTATSYMNVLQSALIATPENIRNLSENAVFVLRNVDNENIYAQVQAQYQMLLGGSKQTPADMVKTTHVPSPSPGLPSRTITETQHQEANYISGKAIWGAQHETIEETLTWPGRTVKKEYFSWGSVWIVPRNIATYLPDLIKNTALGKMFGSVTDICQNLQKLLNTLFDIDGRLKTDVFKNIKDLFQVDLSKLQIQIPEFKDLTAKLEEIKAAFEPMSAWGTNLKSMDMSLKQLSELGKKLDTLNTNTSAFGANVAKLDAVLSNIEKNTALISEKMQAFEALSMQLNKILAVPQKLDVLGITKIIDALTKGLGISGMNDAELGDLKGISQKYLSASSQSIHRGGLVRI